MGNVNNCSNNLKHQSHNLKHQSHLSVSQPRLVATTSQLFLQVHEQRPKSDTDLFRKRPSQPMLPKPPLALLTKRATQVKDALSEDTSRQLLRRNSSIHCGTGYKARSASLRRQRSILRQSGKFKGMNRTTMKKAVETESRLKITQEQRELCVFAARGDLQHVEDLIDGGTNVNSADENQQTVLHHAAMYSRDEVIDSLIERGADVNATDLKGGFSALHWVVINADPQIGNTDHVSRSLSALVNGGCKVNNTDFNFATPLHIAAMKGNKTCIKTLIKLGADPDKVDITGRSCYDIAKDQQIRDLIKQLQAPNNNHIYHMLENQPIQPPRILTQQCSQNPSRRVKPVSVHIYHVLDSSPSPLPLKVHSTPSPPPQSSSTPPPPPQHRRHTQLFSHDFTDTHIYHVLEAPPPAADKSSPPRRRKTITRRK